MKNFILDAIFCFYNYFVCYIPCWQIRKVLYRMGGLKIGKGSRILMKTTIIKPWKVQIGNNTYINEGCHLDARGGIYIGNNASISIGSMIITGTHDSQSEYFEYKELEVNIEDNVWIGARAIILPGAYLKKQCLIGAGSTVIKGIYEFDGFYSGVPAKYIRDRKLKGVYRLSWKPYFR